MLRLLRFGVCALALGASAVVASAEVSGRVLKVLPHFLDEKGRHTIHASLYERDAYQAWLRAHPARRAGLRFDVQWKARDARAASLKLRLELRGAGPGEALQERVLEQAVKRKGLFSNWTSLALTGDDFKQFGELTAWRATLWDGDRLLGKQQSFLWRTPTPEFANP